MRRLRGIFNKIISWLWGRSASRPQDIPKKLGPDVLAEVMREARFLRSQHGVDAKSLEPGEIPGIPRPADGSQIP